MATATAQERAQERAWARATPARARKDYVVAQYHSVFSATGAFMLRQGDFKLIAFGPMLFEPDFPAQLFNLKVR